MELNTFFTEDDCGSDNHSMRRGRGRGRGRVGGRSQGSALSGGSNPGGATSSGHSAGGGRNTSRVLVVGGWKQLLGANPFSFFSSIYAGEGWSLILSSPRMTVAATITA
jgi:hypothetical protein